jgi:hypothetical protein
MTTEKRDSICELFRNTWFSNVETAKEFMLDDEIIVEYKEFFVLVDDNILPENITKFLDKQFDMAQDRLGIYRNYRLIETYVVWGQ